MAYFKIGRSQLFRSLVASSALVASAGLAVACGGRAEIDESGASAPDSTGGSSTGSTGGSSSTEPPLGGTDVENVCSGDGVGEVDLIANGEAPAAWEGKTVHVAAMQNESTFEVETNRRVLSWTGHVVGGAFSFECPDSLVENYYYPSVGVFVDVDGDGKCTSADSGYQLQLYGWGVSVNLDVNADDWTSVDSLNGPLGSATSAFCAGYFPEP